MSANDAITQFRSAVSAMEIVDATKTLTSIRRRKSGSAKIRIPPR